MTIDWRHGLAGCPAEGILISLSGHAPVDLPANALAYALPYEGSYILILYDRLLRKFQEGGISSLLAHVLVHQVTHILQGIHRPLRPRCDESQLGWLRLPGDEVETSFVYRRRHRSDSPWSNRTGGPGSFATIGSSHRSRNGTTQ